jgi:hypothetical protein
VLKQAHIPYILACHLNIVADPDPAYHSDADPDADPDPTFLSDADPCGSGSKTLQKYYKRGKFVKSPLGDLSPGCACLAGDRHRR